MIDIPIDATCDDCLHKTFIEDQIEEGLVCQTDEFFYNFICPIDRLLNSMTVDVSLDRSKASILFYLTVLRTNLLQLLPMHYITFKTTETYFLNLVDECLFLMEEDGSEQGRRLLMENLKMLKKRIIKLENMCLAIGNQ